MNLIVMPVDNGAIKTCFLVSGTEVPFNLMIKSNLINKPESDEA
jgi:hypothetical protein